MSRRLYLTYMELVVDPSDYETDDNCLLMQPRHLAKRIFLARPTLKYFVWGDGSKFLCWTATDRTGSDTSIQQVEDATAVRRQEFMDDSDLGMATLFFECEMTC